MFEHKTLEVIKQEMLENIPPDVDSREGSIIYDATIVVAPKIAELYSNLDVFLNLGFPDTTVGEYLTREAAGFGVFRKLATQAIRRGVFKDTNSAAMDVPIGSRFSADGIAFQVIEKVALGEFKLRAEVAGVTGNLNVVDVIPVEPIPDLGTAEITNVLVAGVDEESDEDLYPRFLVRARKQATSGNTFHYEEWALQVAGVGGAKVIPVWNGPNTVKVILIGTDKKPVLPDVVTNTAEHIEREKPIGATVTVVSSVELPISVTGKLTLAPGAILADVQAQFSEAFEKYLQSIAFVTNPITDEPELIRYTRIANLLLDIPPIIDFDNLLVNGLANTNIQPTFEQVGVVDSVVFT